MGLKDLFKSKAARLKADPRVRWFGKLPTYSDYYTSHGGDEWAEEFKEWILKGFEIYRRRLANSGQATPRLPISGCVIRLPRSEMTVLASVLDFGGDMRGRPFPLCFYAAVPTSQWPGPTSDRLAAASRAIRDLAAIGSEVPRFLNSPGHFESVFRDRELDLTPFEAPGSDASWSTEGKALTLADWFEAARDGLKVKEQGTWLRLAHAFGENLARHDSATFEPTLRFPLAMRLSIDAQSAGWLRWFESRISVARRSLSLVVSGERNGGTGYFSVIARPPVPDDFLLLTPLASTLPYLDDLTRLGGDDAGEAVADAPAGDVPGSSGSWVDFVAGGVTTA